MIYFLFWLIFIIIIWSFAYLIRFMEKRIENIEQKYEKIIKQLEYTSGMAKANFIRIERIEKFLEKKNT